MNSQGLMEGGRGACKPTSGPPFPQDPYGSLPPLSTRPPWNFTAEISARKFLPYFITISNNPVLLATLGPQSLSYLSSLPSLVQITQPISRFSRYVKTLAEEKHVSDRYQQGGAATDTWLEQYPVSMTHPSGRGSKASDIYLYTTTLGKQAPFTGLERSLILLISQSALSCLQYKGEQRPFSRDWICDLSN